MLRDILNKGILSISADDRERIVNKHVYIIFEQKTQYEDLYRVIIGFTAALSILIVVYWRTKQQHMKLKQLNEALQESQTRFRTIINVSGLGAWEYTPATNHYWCSPEYFEILGYAAEDFIQAGDFSVLYEASFKDLLHPDDIEKVLQTFNAYVKSGGNHLYESYFRVRHADGHYAWIRSTGKRVSDGVMDKIFGTHIDVTDIKRVEENVLYLSYRDQLTSLYNRRFFEEQVYKLESDTSLPMSIIMLDVNGLKLINDAFGHAAGDSLLKKTAEVLKRALRADDMICRIGGDEFVVLLPNTPYDTSRALLERIQHATEGEQINGIDLSFSTGTATKTIDDVGLTIYEVLKLAENEMYQVKIGGKEHNRNAAIQMLMHTLYEKSPDERSHAIQVSLLAYRIGVTMHLDGSMLAELKDVGMYHDIGKIAVSESILNKGLPYSIEEQTEFQRHSEVGYNILSSSNEYAGYAPIVLHHHEHWDGTGYPRQLKGEEIPLFSRIIAVADAYDAMVYQRAHALAPKDADYVAVIQDRAGKDFDPKVVNAFLKTIDKFSE